MDSIDRLKVDAEAYHCTSLLVSLKSILQDINANRFLKSDEQLEGLLNRAGKLNSPGLGAIWEKYSNQFEEEKAKFPLDISVKYEPKMRECCARLSRTSNNKACIILSATSQEKINRFLKSNAQPWSADTTVPPDVAAAKNDLRWTMLHEIIHLLDIAYDTKIGEDEITKLANALCKTWGDRHLKVPYDGKSRPRNVGA